MIQFNFRSCQIISIHTEVSGKKALNITFAFKILRITRSVRASTHKTKVYSGEKNKGKGNKVKDVSSYKTLFKSRGAKPPLTSLPHNLSPLLFA